MRLAVAAALAAMLCATSAQAKEWRVERVDTPARVTAIETIDGKPAVNAGGLWYSLGYAERGAKLTFIDMPPRPKQPEGALPDGRVAKGTNDIARVWLSEPTTRYDHGILGDAIESGALTIETRDGKLQTVRLKDDAVFEDLEPRLADLDGDGHDEVVVVKSYLKRGSALAVIALRKGRYEIVAETPPLGGPHRWLNPAGIADFTGDGKLDIALVRQPHVIGELELWRYADGKLRKTASMPGFANHIIGTRALAHERHRRIRRRRQSRPRFALARPYASAHRVVCAGSARDRQRGAAEKGRHQSRSRGESVGPAADRGRARRRNAGADPERLSARRRRYISTATRRR